jgi:hypothetical protein
MARDGLRCNCISDSLGKDSLKMKLIKVHSIHFSHHPEMLEMRITADVGSGPEDMDYSYHPNDPHGLSPQIKKHLKSHPDAVILPAKPIAKE